ncbi:hypothetical protein HK100_002903, partial [Physocladia obscura]
MSSSSLAQEGQPTGFLDAPGTPVLFTIIVYGFVWITSLALVGVFTRRESRALKESINRLQTQLHRMLAADEHAEQTVNSNSNEHLANIHEEETAVNNNNIINPKRLTAARALPRLSVQIHDANSDEKNNDASGNLVVPSTPETKNLLMALAAGDDFDFDEANLDSLPLHPPPLSSTTATTDNLNLTANPPRHQRLSHLSLTDSPLWPSKSRHASPAVEHVNHTPNLKALEESKEPAEVPIPLDEMNWTLDRNLSTKTTTESVLFIPSPLENRSNLLVRASTIPRIPNLWARMFKISTAKFHPDDIDMSSKHAPNSPNRARFVEPQPPVSPLAARVHRLILAAIEADLKVLESRFKKDAV